MTTYSVSLFQVWPTTFSPPVMVVAADIQRAVDVTRERLGKGPNQGFAWDETEGWFNRGETAHTHTVRLLEAGVEGIFDYDSEFGWYPVGPGEYG